MTEQTLTLKKEDVYEEVEKTCEYAGTKSDDGTGKERDRIGLVEENKEMLERFWNESKNTICQALKKFLVGEEEDDSGTYTLALELSSSFDESLLPSMERSLFSFFVINITAKWYSFTNKKDVNEYIASASGNIDDIMRKAYYKKRPQRPKYE